MERESVCVCVYVLEREIWTAYTRASQLSHHHRRLRGQTVGTFGVRVHVRVCPRMCWVGRKKKKKKKKRRRRRGVLSTGSTSIFGILPDGVKGAT